MHARCPKDPKHKRFIATAHVFEEWIVGPHGEFIEQDGEREVEPPELGQVWSCAECGEGAVFVTDDNEAPAEICPDCNKRRATTEEVKAWVDQHPADPRGTCICAMCKTLCWMDAGECDGTGVSARPDDADKEKP